MSGVAEDKQALRRKFFVKWRESTGFSSSLWRHFDEFLLARPKMQRVLAYDPLKSELPILHHLSEHYAKKLRIFIPRIEGTRLLAMDIHSRQTRPKALWQMDLIVVPGLFVDSEGWRLGRGGGYYDRELAYLAREKTVFVGRDWQFVDFVPRDTQDRRVGWGVSESGIHYFF